MTTPTDLTDTDLCHTCGHIRLDHWQRRHVCQVCQDAGERCVQFTAPRSVGPVRGPGDPDRPCPHEDFLGDIGVGRLTAEEGGAVISFTANIRIECAQCGEKFRFIGVPAGAHPARPMCSVDEFELRAPIRPSSADPDFGLGVPGYSIRYTERIEL